MLIGCRKDIAKARGIAVTDFWDSRFIDEQTEPAPQLTPAPTTTREKAVTVHQALADILGDTTKENNAYLKRIKDSKFWKLRSTSGDLKNNYHRKHTEKSIERFRLYQFLSSVGIKTKLLNIASTEDKPAATMEVKRYLTDLIYPAVSPDGTILAKNKNDLIAQIFKLSTKKHSQRVVALDKPSPTVVTLPDDYVHPIEPRIFTVRELARLQSFPDSFEFKSKETTGSIRRKTEVPQYTQVGNAVAPFLAYALAQTIKDTLS
jgi:DNA (cytosine-5)-methyltransferase 1